MDELNAEQRQELEEQLYSQVHHKFDESSNNFETKNLENAEKNASNSKFQTKRYWAGKNLDETLNEVNSMSNSAKIATKSKNNDTIPRTQPASATTPEKNTNPPNNNNRKIRNPFASQHNARKDKAMQQNCNKQNNMQQLIKQTQRNAGPFAEKMQKIQRLSNFHNKKQKANNARAKAQAKPRVVALINLDDDDTEGDDDVLIVPLPPVPVVSVESDSDDNSQQQNPSKKPLAENSSRCVSPASVMSHDDFIAQGDRNRLLVMNNNADSFLEAPSPTTQNKNDSRRISSDDIECIGTFIKPSSMNTKAAGKKDYRVGSNEFRAMDVYESEPDIVSDGIYSKGLKNAARTVGNKSDDSDNDDDDFADIAENPKNRRLRKRRASTSQRGSESNGGGANTSDSENDGVVESGVPFIYCGPALETQKSKKKRRRNESTLSNGGGRMSDTEFVATLNSLAQGGESSNNRESMQVNESESDDDSDDENMPTARDIAELVLNQSTSVQQEQPSESIDEIIELPSTPPDDEAIPPEFAENVDRILAKLNALKEQQMRACESAESENDSEAEEVEVSTELLSTSDILPLTAAVKAEISANDGLNANNVDVESDGSKKIKYFIAYCPANKRNLSDGFGWNEEMRRFYNYSWGGENFREDLIFRTMKRNANLWRISNVDRFPSLKNRSKREKCINCLSFGHSRAKCPKPKRPRICYMCGESGHLEARCPNTLCLQCGSETMSFVTSCKKCMHWNKRICPICKLRGHSLNDCPDKWRRYHSTTKPNQFPNSHVNYNRRRYCCYCGMRGHLSDECRRSFNHTEYPMIASEIKSFEKSYNDALTRTTSTSGIQCQLLYDPKLNVNFTMAQKTNRFQLYGRFLNAVGLGRLIGAKKRSHERENIIRPNTVTITGNDLTKMPPPLSPQMPTSSKKAAQQTPTKALNQKTTQAIPTTSNIVSNMPPPPAPPVQPVLVECDSDSNYSFSDHFEVSSTTKSSPVAPETIEHDQEAQDSTQISTTTAPLPDFISLDGAGNRFQETADTLDLPISSLHTRFVEANSDDDDDDANEHDTNVADDVMPAVEQEKPCKAKIFISNEHYRYFQSKEGQVYLCKVLPEYELTGSLEKTSAGYALFLTGLPKNQDKMQQALLKKYEDLNNAKAKHQLDNQLPKNVNTLIRFLRDSIKQLYNNLGSATDLYKRLYDCEKMQTKISQKSADRIRRTLNMILLGQAGLHNGDVHFETLLKSLRKLLSTECNKVEKTPEKLREEINASWRMLFTSYDHKRYASLLAAYIQMPATKRNRMHTLKIEANILDDRVLDVSLSKEQKERLNAAKMETTEANTGTETDATVTTNNKEARKETAELATVAPLLAQQSSELNEANKKSNNKTKNLNVTTTTNKTPTTMTTTTSSSTDSVQNDDVDIIDSFCENLIKAIEESFNSIECGPRVHASKSLSTVWSNKSQVLLNEIIVLAQSTKSKHLDRLERINKLAAEAKLSYINYCDIVKIHKRVMKK